MSSAKRFPIRVVPRGFDRELVDIDGPGFSFTMCAHVARTLAQMLLERADKMYCDGYRHGDESTMFDGARAGGVDPDPTEASHAR